MVQGAYQNSHGLPEPLRFLKSAPTPLVPHTHWAACKSCLEISALLLWVTNQENAMAMTTLQGPVSHYKQSTQTVGYSNQGTGQTRTAQVLTFRVSNKPVTFKFESGGSISDGDGVTVLGFDKAGTLQGLCVRNDTTGAIFKASYIPFYVIGGLALLMALGFFSVSFYAALPFLCIGGALGYYGWRNANANKVLAAIRLLPPA